MITSIFLVFVGGWLLWFWIDKPPVSQFGLPPPGDSMVENFQRSIDLLKAGHPDMAYVYIWHAHYFVISLVVGMLLGVAFRSLSGQLSRRRRRRLYSPRPPPSSPPAGDGSTSGRPAVPGESAAHDDTAK